MAKQLITHKMFENYILGLSETFLDYPFGPGTAVYKVGEGESARMFALITESKQPVQISLKCDPNLAITLREKYETVVPGYHLNKKHWNTVIASGQLSEEEIKDLINHSYLLVSGKDTI
jgi:predicted DNA-binding protein (MmcQ/YjbR family)